MGINEYSKNILISHDIISEERRRLERKEEKREKEKRKTKEKWISPLTRKTKKVNKNGKN